MHGHEILKQNQDSWQTEEKIPKLSVYILGLIPVAVQISLSPLNLVELYYLQQLSVSPSAPFCCNWMAKKRRGPFTDKITHEPYFLGKAVRDNTGAVSLCGSMSHLSLASKWHGSLSKGASARA